MFDDLVSAVGHRPGNAFREQEYSQLQAISQSVWRVQEAVLGGSELGMSRFSCMDVVSGQEVWVNLN